MNRAPDRTDQESESRGGTLDRRRLLKRTALGGGTVLAGCLEFPTGKRRGPEIERDGDAWTASFDGHLDALGVAQPEGHLATFVQEVGFGVHPRTRDPVFVLADDVEETDDSVSITLKPDLEWSTGAPLTAEDVGRWLYMLRTGSSWLIRVPEIEAGTRHPRSSLEGITDVEWDETTVTVRGEFETVARPLFALNDHLGSHPGTYHEELWDAFGAAYDDEPWEDEETWAAVTTLVDENIRSVGEELLPEGGINLEREYDGAGLEAAYSGLWYPYRTDGSRLSFTVNEAHPFADRVEYDDVVWTFHGEPDASLSDLRSGTTDGAMRRDVSNVAVEDTPPSVTTFDGPASQGIALALNHGTRHLGNRDVRAALLHAIDRTALVDTLFSATNEPVAVPGADLQAERWVPDEFRSRLRTYPNDPDRARTLLERAGFRHVGDGWVTPDGDPFDLTVLTAGKEAALERAIAEELRSFGIDASMRSLERTSYEMRVRSGTFVATTDVWSSPNAAGLPRSRTGDYVQRIAYGSAFDDRTFLAGTASRAVESTEGLSWTAARTDDPSSERRLGFDSLESLRAITVEAPPLGEPGGELREWPYLYHAVRSASAPDEDEAVEHAKVCTWVYNYQLPRLELVVDVPTVFHDTEEWDVPSPDGAAWQHVRTGRRPGGLWAALGWGHIDVA